MSHNKTISISNFCDGRRVEVFIRSKQNEFVSRLAESLKSHEKAFTTIKKDETDRRQLIKEISTIIIEMKSIDEKIQNKFFKIRFQRQSEGEDLSSIENDIVKSIQFLRLCYQDVIILTQNVDDLSSDAKLRKLSEISQKERAMVQTTTSFINSSEHTDLLTQLQKLSDLFTEMETKSTAYFKLLDQIKSGLSLFQDQEKKIVKRNLIFF